MHDNEILAKIQEAVSGVLEIEKDEIQPNTRLKADLAAESIDLLDIASELEKFIGKPVDFKELPQPPTGSRNDIVVSELITFLKTL
jgi:acyl carrier protein